FKHAAGDVYEGTIVSERLSGEVALNIIGKNEARQVVKLPQARMGPLRAAAVSPDFNWMAFSNGSRGAILDVTHNIRTTEVRSFHGVWFGPDQMLYVDFPKFMETDRQIGRIDPTSGSGATV